MLLANQLTFSESSRPIQASEYQKAQQQGLILQEIPVAVDAIVVAVHPRFPLPALTLSQLKEIYIGKFTNWSQLGGENLPIVAYSRSLEAGGTRASSIEFPGRTRELEDKLIVLSRGGFEGCGFC